MSQPSGSQGPIPGSVRFALALQRTRLLFFALLAPLGFLFKRLGTLDTTYSLVAADCGIGALSALAFHRVYALQLDRRWPFRPAWVWIPLDLGVASEARGVDAGRTLAVGYLHDAQSRIEVFGFEGRPKGALRLPAIGSAGITAEPDRAEAYVTFTSFNQPTTIYRVDLVRPDVAPERPEAPVDPASVEVEQVFYPRNDGTRIGMFLFHRKGIVLDGQNPTLLTGYCGFDVSKTRTFSAPVFQWLNARGVFALANLRGGGECGDAWHEAGMLSRKQKVFDDFIAAAEYMIAKKYTSSKRLAITGTSNGGPAHRCRARPVARPLRRPGEQRPAPRDAPLQDFLMARYWVPEYGSAADPAQFEWLYAYSPYKHVRPGTHYPAVLVTAGENDPRVHPFHARKMAAALQAVTAAAQDLETDSRKTRATP